MNITPEFRTSKEWKKYKRALKHPAAMEFYINLGCELEGITRKSKTSEGRLETADLDDLVIMAGADEYSDIEPQTLETALIDSGIMVKDDEGYRMLSWERENAKLISCRRNGSKGGKKPKGIEPNQTDERNQTQQHETEPNVINQTERNGTERNGTGGIPHGEPTGNPRLETSDVTDEEVPF
jgi:hypothetical protein